MPKVGGVEFPYTKKGMQKAKAWSEMIGKPMQMEKKKAKKKYNTQDAYDEAYDAYIESLEKLKGKKQKFTPPEESKGFQKYIDKVNAEEMAMDRAFRKKFGEYEQGGQIPQETMLRAMFALGGEIPAGRRMYGMGKKKKSLQTADVGPVRGMKKGGKVKYHV